MRTPTVSPEQIAHAIANTQPVAVTGRIRHLVGLNLEAEGINAAVGEICHVVVGRHSRVPCEVIGFAEDRVLLTPLHYTDGMRPGQEVVPSGRPLKIPVGEGLLGRVLDGTGAPIDDRGPVATGYFRHATRRTPTALSRPPITEVLPTGVRAMDGLLTCGRGQRLGIFAGSGVGKSTLLGMICRNATADVNVIALVGERGREVREFVEQNLGADGLARSVVVAATSDETPLMRIKGAETAMAIAEFFRDQGKNVVFMMDSVTRYAMALREVGIAAGEVPATRGYTPSVFARLPILLERAGTSPAGSITGFFSVLVDGDDIRNDPITDAIRAILDGHVVLSRDLANANVFPAIDILGSISRLARNLLDEQSNQQVGNVLDLYSTFAAAEDLINIGAYARGSNPRIDEAVSKVDRIRSLIRQDVSQVVSWDEARAAVAALTN